MDNVDFPRGRPTKPPSTATTTSTTSRPSHHKHNKKETLETSNKRLASDFLFGSGNNTKDGDGNKKKKKKKTKVDSDDTKSSSSKSLLPLGGGGVVFPSHHPSSSSGSHHHHPHGWIEGLSFSKLVKNMRLLACVREVYSDLIVFSLPNLWTAYMMLTPTTDKSPCVVSVGQYLSVVVVKAVQESTKEGLRRRIQVSCAPALVNSDTTMASSREGTTTVRGQVLSVEDHGLLIDLGLGRRGFLPLEAIEGEYTVDDDDDSNGGDPVHNNTGKKSLLAPGRIDDFVIAESSTAGKDSPSSTIVKLCLPLHASSVVQRLQKTPALAALQPGWLVQVSVESMVRNGLCVSFGNGVFRGAIEVGHLGATFVPTTKQPNDDWKAVFQHHGKNLVARIIAVDASSKIVRLSLQPHLLALVAPSSSLSSRQSSLAIGAVVENAVVVRVDPGLGAVLAIPPRDGDEEMEHDAKEAAPLWNAALWADDRYQQAAQVQTVYVHISKAFDEQKGGKTSEAVFAKEFAPSTLHKVRLLSTSNMIDGMATGATAASVLEAHVLTHADLVAGGIYRQVPVCAHVNGGGVLVDFGMGVRGLIPPMHLFDHTVTSEYRAKMLKVVYALDAKVDVRVLSVEAGSKRCYLTTKKSLIKCKDIITSFADVRIGQKTTGFVTHVDDKGLFVTFFNGVYGRVTARSLLIELGIDNVKESYAVGDAVNCCVVNIRRRHKRGLGKLEADGGETAEADVPSYWELTLSLRSRSMMERDESEPMAVDVESRDSSKPIPLRLGTVLQPRSMRVVEVNMCKEKDKDFVCGHAIVSIPSKDVIESPEQWTLPDFVECKLPFDQLLDEYDAACVTSASSLDALAVKLLTVGKTIEARGILLTDPRKTAADYSAGTGSLAVISIRQKFVEHSQAKAAETDAPSQGVIMPAPATHLYMGAQVLGYVAQVDSRHGAFVRFMDGLTGLVPKKKGGLELPKFQTITARVLAVDVTTQPQKILLGVGEDTTPIVGRKKPSFRCPTVGEQIDAVEVISFDFQKASMKILDAKWKSMDNCRVRLHHSMAYSKPILKPVMEQAVDERRHSISKYHPFADLAPGSVLHAMTVAAIDVRAGLAYVELSSQAVEGNLAPTFFEKHDDVTMGMQVTGTVASVDHGKGGLYLQICPGVSGFLPALEMSDDVDILNNFQSHFPVGCRLECVVIDKNAWLQTRSRYSSGHAKKRGVDSDKHKDLPYLSFLKRHDKVCTSKKPENGDVVIGRINRKLHVQNPPALAVELRGGFVGRCCVTEMFEPDEWTNMPVGQIPVTANTDTLPSSRPHGGMDDEDDASAAENESHGVHGHGRFVKCRVYGSVRSKPAVDVSFRQSRLEGDLEDDEKPEVGTLANAYVVETNKKGCFLRLSRQIEGRALLKEICDGFLPDPTTSFPPGRLVVGKVKAIRKNKKKDHCGWVVDLDMRESVVLSEDKLKFEQVQMNGKYKGIVTRVEDFGVFVRIDNSDFSGLVHKSECSDNFVKSVADLYDPGDLVKVLVIKKDDNTKQLGFSMKASHFDGDDASDDDASSVDSEAADVSKEVSDAMDSDDEDYVTKLAAQEHPANSSDSDSESASSDIDGEEVVTREKDNVLMDTDVGFEWNDQPAKSMKPNTQASISDDDDDDESGDGDGDDDAHKSSHKARRKHAQRAREEQEIARREAALADGTADEKPETAGDFERLLASSPNSSELWIRYMAFHMSLADIPAARNVAERSFKRIEFRQEREKMNVWSALLTLELRYGSEKSFQETLDRACQQNNPKYVYLRVCEMLEKESTRSADAAIRCDEMHAKMTKKFKTKKKVWLAHFEYLLKTSRPDEAHALSKRAMQSLPLHKHVETMSRFAQLVFEYGKPERARTIFDGLLLNYPKRLDWFFVYIDKELKHGDVSHARRLLERQVSTSAEGKLKLSDKQMKSFFKKWFSVEEQHGNTETQEKVKSAARAYVQQTSAL